jgi:copper chaperone NosL
MLRRYYNFLLYAILSLFLSACSGDRETGPVEVRWDQDNCERCRMMLSDRNFGAQIRYYPEGKRSMVVKFDDIGCAALWLKEQPWQQDPETQIWVTDHRSGEWIDARQATYIQRNNSPMGFDLGAQAEADADGMNYIEAVQHIENVEGKFNTHGNQHQHHHHQQVELKQQGLARESPDSEGQQQ